MFVFDARLNETNIDAIRDFNVNDDVIHLKKEIFWNIGNGGSLAANAFRLGIAAEDEDDRIIYHSDTGMLLFDLDGNGEKEAQVIAYLTEDLALTHLNFFVI